MVAGSFDEKGEAILMPVSYPERVVERFWAKVEKGGECWEWTACLVGGYGDFWVGDGLRMKAHRFAYELLVGDIPEGLTLDHLCRNRACVNPAHLEPVSNAENVLRGAGPPATNARKTHCKNGHEFTPENTFNTVRGHRECRTCRAAYMREYRPQYKARLDV